MDVDLSTQNLADMDFASLGGLNPGRTQIHVFCGFQKIIKKHFGYTYRSGNPEFFMKIGKKRGFVTPLRNINQPTNPTQLNQPLAMYRTKEDNIYMLNLSTEKLLDIDLSTQMWIDVDGCGQMWIDVDG